ncbi:MAG: glycosyltransferase [Candidatus Sulfotelmatobacter sp.]
MLSSRGIGLPGYASEKTEFSAPREVENVPARMKVLLVTSFPPSRGDLNEYGYHLACALRNDPQVDLVILADETDAKPELEDFHIERCWRFDSALNPMRLLAEIWKHRPDVVWFNIGFSTFARKPIAAFMALMVPALARLSGYYTHITLHTIFERINLKDAGVRWPWLYRSAGHIGTQLLLLADDVSVLLPSFRDDLAAHYGKRADRVQFRPHGTFEGMRLASLPQLDGPERIILAFGYWGTYKRIDLLLECMDGVARAVPNAVLVIAGTNHPSTPEYLETLQKQWANRNCVRFLGYVPEDELPTLFSSASVLALPYSSAAGTSGVMHQACQYGLPMVAAAIPEIVEIANEEQIAVEFYAPGDGSTLATQLIRVLSSEQLHRRAAEQNLSAAAMTPMAEVAGEYLQLFKQRVSKSSRQVAEQ